MFIEVLMEFVIAPLGDIRNVHLIVSISAIPYKAIDCALKPFNLLLPIPFN